VKIPNRPYLLAVACYLLIPAVMMASGFLFRLIDPEMARGHADYVSDYRLLLLAQRGALMGCAALALVLWLSTCYLVLKSRRRSPGWLPLAAAGPFGFIAISMLEDRSSAPEELHQQFIRKLKMRWRVPLEIAMFVSVWFLAYEFVVLKRELMIRYESFSTGTPIATIIGQQLASSGMWAFSEWLEEIYLVVLIYLLWPILINFSGRAFNPRTIPVGGGSRQSGD
jgi:hypothetical protein